MGYDGSLESYERQARLAASVLDRRRRRATDTTVKRPRSEHAVIIDADDCGLTTRLICTAPPDALCHAIWTCDCEEQYAAEIRNGVPAHRPYSDDPDTWHAGRLDPTACAFRDWYEGSEETLRGTVRVPVSPEWHGDHYTFELAASQPVAATREETSR